MSASGPTTATLGPADTQPWREVGHVLLFSALGLGLGAVAGVVWWAVVDLPAYRINAAGEAITSERGLASQIVGDAWFAVLGAVTATLLGVLAWRRFRNLGWSVVLLAGLVALAAALVCWSVGSHLGPGELSVRLAAARPGDLVPIELTIRARAGLILWPLFAVIPVLLGSSLGRDPDDPR